MKKDTRGLVIKVVVLLFALVGVFWARSALEESVQTQQQTQETTPETIPAKVEFGK